MMAFQPPSTYESSGVTRQDQFLNITCTESNSDNKMERLELIVKKCPKFEKAKASHNVDASGSNCLRAEFVGKKPRATFRGFRSIEKRKKPKRRRKTTGPRLQLKSEKRAKQRVTEQKRRNHTQIRLHQGQHLKGLLTDEKLTCDDKNLQADLKPGSLEFRPLEETFELLRESEETPKKLKRNFAEGYQTFNPLSFLTNSYEGPASVKIKKAPKTVSLAKPHPFGINLKPQDEGRISSHVRMMPWDSIASLEDGLKEITPSLFDEMDFCGETIDPSVDSGLI
mmetsp:Transcript_5082/g.7174  ORF Transcript_5082/g.7174 Transcript_5082/m.7174 type:complete len:282 (+) Transcript_5082:158-1003(+)